MNGIYKTIHVHSNVNYLGLLTSSNKFAEYKQRSLKTFLNKVLKNGYNLSGVVRKPAFCICENKDADQLRGDREADQRLCFRYMVRVIPLVSKSKISSP